MSELTTLIEKQKAIQAEMQAHGKQALKAAFTEFFEKHPEVESLFWYQYTPYFNDGDECVFGVHDIEMELSEDFCKQIGIEHRPVDFEESYVEGASLYTLRDYSGGYSDPKIRPGAEALYEDLKALKDASQELEDLFKAAFGDHALVVADRNGFRVDHYEHD